MKHIIAIIGYFCSNDYGGAHDDMDSVMPMKFNIWRKWRAIRSFGKEARYTLMGHRDREIRRDIDELRGAIAALQLERFIQECANPHSRAELAVITCLPPDETGIARFSESHLSVWPKDLDIYTHITDHSKIVHAMRTICGKNSDANLLSLESLPFNHLRRPYRNIVFVIGNSDHNIVLLKSLKNFIESFGSQGVHCYLHDPACFNVTRHALGLTEQAFAAQLAQLHDRKLRDIRGGNKHVFDDFIDAGIFGPRIISHMFGVRSFIVNSLAAKEMILSNCGDQASHVGVLYHPVFELEKGVDPELRKSENNGELVIGSYGCPSLNKLTDVIIEACHLLTNEGRNVRLILSGYGSKIYLERHFGNEPPSWIDVRHQSNEADFQRDMVECDIAIQLRKHNLGESSGVVPTLLKMEKTVITSPIGAFTAYGDAVVYFDGNSTALADLLRKNVRVPPECIHDFVSKHGVEQFNDAFRAILSENSGFAPLSAPELDIATNSMISEATS
ncbi:glycosyltransferase family protein [Sphingobium chungbukense]|uniref:hypothetical protein n=1 Tax=Sphingobium chungbukense TaxID=56193 RepID=UPI0012EEBD2A|nr:hypothetical protein [Sphingobium chungbukense]